MFVNMPSAAWLALAQPVATAETMLLGRRELVRTGEAACGRHSGIMVPLL